MNNVGNLSDMVNSSIVVMTRPSVSTFETFERRGNLQAALVYVGIAAIISGLLGAVASPAGAIAGMLAGLIGSIVGFLVFVFAVFYIGRSQGGTGTLDEVAYSFALFSAPLTVIGAVLSLFGRLVPILGCLIGLPLSLALMVAQIYLGYLAVQSSMNLTDKTKAIITLVLAGIVSLVVASIIGGIFLGGALLAGGV